MQADNRQTPTPLYSGQEEEIKEHWKAWNVNEGSMNENDEHGDVAQYLGTHSDRVCQGKTSWENNLVSLKSHNKEKLPA